MKWIVFLVSMLIVCNLQAQTKKDSAEKVKVDTVRPQDLMPTSDTTAFTFKLTIGQLKFLRANLIANSKEPFDLTQAFTQSITDQYNYQLYLWQTEKAAEFNKRLRADAEKKSNSPPKKE